MSLRPSPTPLQRHWVDVLEAVRLAREELDPAAYEAFTELLVTLAARLGAEQLQREWRRGT